MISTLSMFERRASTSLSSRLVDVSVRPSISASLHALQTQSTARRKRKPESVKHDRIAKRIVDPFLAFLRMRFRRPGRSDCFPIPSYFDRAIIAALSSQLLRSLASQDCGERVPDPGSPIHGFDSWRSRIPCATPMSIFDAFGR